MTETPQAAPSPQQVLADLIDAYATAKASGNETLQRLAIAPLQQFLNTHSIVENVPPVGGETPYAIDNDPKPELTDTSVAS